MARGREDPFYLWSIRRRAERTSIAVDQFGAREPVRMEPANSTSPSYSFTETNPMRPVASSLI